MSAALSRAFGQSGSDTDYRHYRAVLVPRFQLLSLRVRSRVFQGERVPEILRRVLAGLDVAFELTADYHPRNYCVQYRESDFAFASRLMEEEGIRYYFRHGHDGHSMVLADDPLQHPELSAPAPAVYDAVGNLQVPRIHDWECRQRLTSARWSLWDDHFEKSGRPFASAAVLAEEVKVGTTAHRLRGSFNDSLDVRDGPLGLAAHFDDVAHGWPSTPRGVAGPLRRRPPARPAAQRGGGRRCLRYFRTQRFPHVLPGLRLRIDAASG